MGTATLRALLGQIERENGGSLLSDGKAYYQVGVLRNRLAAGDLDQMVHWDSTGRIYREPVNETAPADLLYTFEEPPTWQAPSSSRRWAEAISDVGWGWPVIIGWTIIWLASAVTAPDTTWRTVSVVMLTVTVCSVAALLFGMFHRLRIEDARKEERARAAKRWLDEHPRKGKSWRDR